MSCSEPCCPPQLIYQCPTSEVSTPDIWFLEQGFPGKYTVDLEPFGAFEMTFDGSDWISDTLTTSCGDEYEATLTVTETAGVLAASLVIALVTPSVDCDDISITYTASSWEPVTQNRMIATTPFTGGFSLLICVNPANGYISCFDLDLPMRYQCTLPSPLGGGANCGDITTFIFTPRTATTEGFCPYAHDRAVCGGSLSADALEIGDSGGGLYLVQIDFLQNVGQAIYRATDVPYADLITAGTEIVLSVVSINPSSCCTGYPTSEVTLVTG